VLTGREFKCRSGSRFIYPRASADLNIDWTRYIYARSADDGVHMAYICWCQESEHQSVKKRKPKGAPALVMYGDSLNFNALEVAYHSFHL
jgi:hypothetical protein